VIINIALHLSKVLQFLLLILLPILLLLIIMDHKMIDHKEYNIIKSNHNLQVI